MHTADRNAANAGGATHYLRGFPYSPIQVSVPSPLGVVQTQEAVADRRQAATFLEEGGQVLKARAQLRDQPGGERSMEKTVAIFNTWTGNNLSVEDGWRFMISLKQAREIQGFFNADDYVDGAVYFSLLGEEESGNRDRKKP